MATNVTVQPLCPLLEDMRRLPGHGNSSFRHADYVAVLVHGLAGLLGLALNGLILFVVGCRMRQTVVTAWVLHLALSDLLASASLPFFTHFLAVGHSWQLGRTFCKLHSSVFFLNMFASGFLLCAISLDRCVQAARPVWAQNHRGARGAHGLCAAIWALAVLNTAPYFVFRDTIVRRDGRVMCYYNVLQLHAGPGRDAACHARQLALALSKFLLAFALPLAVIACSHVAVSRRLRARRRSGRFVRLVAAVVAAFALCWGPYHVFSLLEARAHGHPALRPLVWRALPLATSLAFLNPVLNPLLYVFTCPDVLRRLRRSLRSVLETVLADGSEPGGAGGSRRRRASSSSGVRTPALPLRGLHCGGRAPPPKDPARPRDEGGPLSPTRPQERPQDEGGPLSPTRPQERPQDEGDPLSPTRPQEHPQDEGGPLTLTLSRDEGGPLSPTRPQDEGGLLNPELSCTAA